MNLLKKLCIVILIQACSLLLLPTKCFASASEVTVSTLQEMQPYVETAMESYQTSYELTYTGNSFLTTTQWNTLLSNILNADNNDYLCNVMKSTAYSQTGVIGNIKITFTFAYWETADQVAAVDAKVTDVLSTLGVSNMNDYEKEKAIHDWIISHVSYDKSLTQHSAYSAITDPYKTVCQGYALLAYKMFTKAGLPARIETGTGNGQLHAWNLVKVDGNWYQIDLTWDDPISSTGDVISYDFYNLTDAEMAVSHKWKNTYPPANTEFSDILKQKISSDSGNATIYNNITDALNLNYLLSDNTCNSNPDIQSTVYHTYAKGQTQVKFRYTNKSSLTADIKAALKALGFITTYSYTASDYTRTALTKDAIVNLSFATSTPTKVSDFSFSDGKKDHENLQFILGGKPVTLTTTITPADASTKTIIWTSSDPAVATVTNGVVKASGGGTALITGTTLDGGIAVTCPVAVTAYVKSIKFDKSSLPLTLGGDDATLTTIFTPVSANNKGLTWTSSNPGVATVDEGTVHAVATGKAVIKATSADGSKVTSCSVTVYDPSSGITISVPNITVALGKTAPLKTTVSPTTAYKVANWKSSNEAIAKVSATGVITPVAVGSVTITATTSDNAYSVTCDVTVIQGVTKITLDKTKQTMVVGGENQTLTATITPATATVQTVTWKSSRPDVATVDENGVVHAVGPGTAVITCTSTQDTTKTARCTITVTGS